MSNSAYGYLKLPRSLLNDPLWKSLPYTYRHIYITILSNMAFKPTTQDDFGVLVHLKPGQFLTTQRDLVRLCEEEDIDKSLVHRALDKFKKLGFSNQTSNHKKTIITITRRDIIELLEPNFDPNSNQTRTIKEERQERQEETTTPLTPQISDSKNPIDVDDVSFSISTKNKLSDVDFCELIPQKVNITYIICPLLDKIDIPQHDKEEISSKYSQSQIALALEGVKATKNIRSLPATIKFYCQNPPQTPKSKSTIENENRSIAEKNREFARKFDDFTNGVCTVQASTNHVQIIFNGCSKTLFLDYKENAFQEQFFNLLRKVGLNTKKNTPLNGINLNQDLTKNVRNI